MNPADLPENQMKRRIAPGFWVDANGAGHISITELLAFFDLPDTSENREQVKEMAIDLLKKNCPDSKIIYREKNPLS